MMPPIEENVSDAQRLASVTGRGLSPSYVTKARDYPSSTTNHAFPCTHIALEIYLNSGETAAELLGGTGRPTVSQRDWEESMPECTVWQGLS